MKKMKLLTAILFCLGIAGMASAYEFISIDLNGSGDANAYDGTGAFTNGTTIWRAYSGGAGGWGKAMGSPRSANLADSDEPNRPSTYAAQVWIGDDANIPHGYYGSGSGTLMDDGFEKTTLPADPNPTIRLWGIGAYQGTFDIYVYGANDGNFTLATLDVNFVGWEPNEPCYPVIHPNDSNSYRAVFTEAWSYETKQVSGGFGGNFVEGQNYVVFQAVDINVYEVNSIVYSTDPCDLNSVDAIASDANRARVDLSYSNVINGLQLVRLREPIEIQDGLVIRAPKYDVAYDTNRRLPSPPDEEPPGEGEHFGPDVNSTLVFYLDGREYMTYDINVASANSGEYDVNAGVITKESPADLQIYLDDVNMGILKYEQDEDNSDVNETLIPVRIKFFDGKHALKWRVISANRNFNVAYLKFYRVGDAVMDNCSEVYKYSYDLEKDFTQDCRVDFNDLAVITGDWLNCYSRDPNDCL